MKTKIDLTPYQKSILAQGNKVGFKTYLWRYLSTAFLFLLCFGFYQKINHQLPEPLFGWLMFGTVCVIALNWLGVFAIALMAGLSFVTKKLIFDEEYIQERLSSIKYQKMRCTIVTMVQNGKILSNYNQKLYAIVDMTGDWLLVALLITNNSPIVALMHGSALLLQYWFHKMFKGNIISILSTFKDPLENDSSENIDELMDKLCDPNISTDDAPKE